jgi:hypothetical protein
MSWGRVIVWQMLLQKKVLTELVAWFWHLILSRLIECCYDYHGNFASPTSFMQGLDFDTIKILRVCGLVLTSHIFQVDWMLLWSSWELCGYGFFYAGAGDLKSLKVYGIQSSWLNEVMNFGDKINLYLYSTTAISGFVLFWLPNLGSVVSSVARLGCSVPPS